MSAANRRHAQESQEQSELEISAITTSDDYDHQAPGLGGIVSRLFKLPWVGSEPADHDRGRALRKAVRAEDIPRIKKMLKEGVGVNESQEASLACIATRRRNLELLDLLKEAGVDLNQGDRRNRASRTRTPLQEAARKGWAEGVEYLIKARVDLDAEDDVGATALTLAVRAGKHGVAKKLLVAGASASGGKSARMAPLHEAASPEMATLLLEHGADLETRDRGGATALHHQARAGRADMVDFLLVSGADLEAKDERGRTALFCPGAKGEVLSIFQKLLGKGADASVRDLEMNTFIHLAATRCVSPKVLEWLYEKKPELWAIKNKSGETPLDIITSRAFIPLSMRIKAEQERTARRAGLLEVKSHSIFEGPRGGGA